MFPCVRQLFDSFSRLFLFFPSIETDREEMHSALKRQEDEGMKRWSSESERWPVEPFCRDWKRQRALTSVGGFGLSSCLLVHPCGIRESKMSKLTHFLFFAPTLSLFFSVVPSPLCLVLSINGNPETCENSCVFLCKCVCVVESQSLSDFLYDSVTMLLNDSIHEHSEAHRLAPQLLCL